MEHGPRVHEHEQKQNKRWHHYLTAHSHSCKTFVLMMMQQLVHLMHEMFKIKIGRHESLGHPARDYQQA